jgi:hypothetical protein
MKCVAQLAIVFFSVSLFHPSFIFAGKAQAQTVDP